MKKITLLITFVTFAFFANAQVLLDETFNYESSSLLTESTWTNTLLENGAVVGSIGIISSEPLAYGDANGMYALSGLGKLITSDYTSGGSNFLVAKALPTSLTSGVVYLSLLCKPGVDQLQSNSEIMALSINSGNGPKVLIGKGIVNAEHFRFATTRASSSNADYRWATTEYADVSQTFLLVVKYDWTAKTASLFVNPVVGSSNEPSPDVIDNNSTKDVSNPIDGIRFRVTGNSVAKFQVSGVRVSTSWADAVGKQGASNVHTSTVSNLIRANGKTILVPEIGDIEVYNLQGSLVKQAKNENQISIDLKSGLFIVKFTNQAGQVFTNKLIIQ